MARLIDADPPDAKIKAYKCWEDYEGYSTVVFAETAGKARYVAMNSDTLGEDLTFKDVRVRRIPVLDGCYKGRREMDWFDPDDRLAMVKEAGYRCDDDGFDPDECVTCSSKEYCSRYEDYKEESEEE